MKGISPHFGSKSDRSSRGLGLLWVMGHCDGSLNDLSFPLFKEYQ